MTSSVINYPSGIITTVNTSVRVRPLVRGTRQLPTYTIAAIAPSVQSITTSAAAITGATTLNITASPIPIRAGISLTFGTVTVTVTRQAKMGDLSLSISAASGAIASGVSATYTPVANAIGNTLLSVSPTPTFLDSGEILTFGTSKAVVVDQSPVNSTLIQVAPLAAAVTPSSTATTKALLAVVGATDASPSSAPKTTDTTNYLSGAGMEMATIGTNRTLNVTFNEIEGDLGGIIIKQILFNDIHYNREIYAVVSRPNGEQYEGAAIVTQGDGQAPVQEKVTRTANMQFQGSSFIYTPPTADVTVAASLMA